LSILKQHGVPFELIIAIISLMLLNISGYLPLGFVQKLDNFSHVVRLNFLMPRTQDNRVVIV